MVIAALFIGVETLAVCVLDRTTGADDFGVLYLLGALVISTRWGIGLAAATSIASATAFDYFRNWPVEEFAPIENGIVIAVFLTVALSMNFVAGVARARVVEADARRRAADLTAELARIMLRSSDIRTALDIAEQCLAQALGLGFAEIELAEIRSDDQRWAIPLHDGTTPLGTLSAPVDLPEPTRRCLRDRVAPALEILLCAAHDREAINHALIASRARIVAAADEARRRLERDLHDGAQQRLVSLGLQLRKTQASLPPELVSLRAELDGIVADLTGISMELQEFSRGIHPAIVAKGGLGPALKTLARRCSVPVVLELVIERRLPTSIEVGVYYVVAEALTNTAKHAQASNVNVRAEIDNEKLSLLIRDDGRGGADPTKGSGLVGLIDRVEALGGNMRIVSPPAAGTRLHIAIPARE
ncbi:DUF4118 domain-containing protein [Nocardia sp. CA-129566]|uniref:sensor histidine kinase n=1 Tax=Nocardia sp. CA-129566 TaxID=3239976 RepID=UPI003D97380B